MAAILSRGTCNGGFARLGLTSSVKYTIGFSTYPAVEVVQSRGRVGLGHDDEVTLAGQRWVQAGGRPTGHTLELTLERAGWKQRYVEIIAVTS